MKCFNHPLADAVGTCKHCARGVCHDCLALVDDTISCKGACESAVGAVNRLININTHAYRSKRGPFLLGSLFFLSVGAAFIIAAIVDYPRRSALFPAIMGGLFLLYGVVITVRYRRAEAAARSSG